MAGRPTKYTPETVQAILDGVAAGLTNKDAALCAGISEDTLINWTKRHADFSDRLARARAKRSRDLLSAIAGIGAKDRDWRALAEVLDRTAPEYRKTASLDIKHGGTVRHEHAALDAAVEAVAAERGLDPAAVLAEAEAVLAATGGDG